MLTNLNIVKSMNRPKLLDRLEELERQLSICEKALSDYLETKKLIYPRFYFISSADLLDILSNGKVPSFHHNNVKFVSSLLIHALHRNRKQSRNGLQAFAEVVWFVGETAVETRRRKADEICQRNGSEGRRGNGHAWDMRLHRKGIKLTNFARHAMWNDT